MRRSFSVDQQSTLDASDSSAAAVNCLCLNSFLLARSDEVPVVDDVHCLTRGDVAVMPRAFSQVTVDCNGSARSRCV